MIKAKQTNLFHKILCHAAFLKHFLFALYFDNITNFIRIKIK